MRPVSEEFPVTQGFGSLATRGVHGNPNGSQVQVLVALYGDYQPDGHNGADIGCPVGTAVYAARAGTVVVCDWDVNLPGDDSWSASGYFQRFAFFKRFGGRLLVVKVGPNDYDVYAHLSAWKVGYGQQVSEGQLVALSGDSSAGMDGQLGPHLHTERIVDLTYSTGGGLIFGRTDPTSVWGGMAAMGGTITPLSQEDELVPNATDQVFTSKDGSTVSLQDILNSIDAKIEATQASVAGFHAADVDFRGEFDLIRARFANLPAAVLNQSFKLADGTVTNLAGILTAIHAQPVTGGAVVNQTADPQAVVRALAAQLNK